MKGALAYYPCHLSDVVTAPLSLFVTVIQRTGVHSQKPCVVGSTPAHLQAGKHRYALISQEEYKPSSAWPSPIKLDLHPTLFLDLGLNFQYGLFSLSGYFSEIGSGQWACLSLGQVSCRHTDPFSYSSSTMPVLIMEKSAEMWEQ